MEGGALIRPVTCPTCCAPIDIEQTNVYSTGKATRCPECGETIPGAKPLQLADTAAFRRFYDPPKEHSTRSWWYRAFVAWWKDGASRPNDFF